MQKIRNRMIAVFVSFMMILMNFSKFDTIFNIIKLVNVNAISTSSSLEEFQNYAISNWTAPIRAKYLTIQNTGRAFGAGRSSGRKHAAIDYVCDSGSNVYSMTDGVVTGYFYFYEGTYALEVKNVDGSVVRYGEIQKASNVSTGSNVTKGQIIGTVIPNTTTARSHMLHLELYRGTASGSLTDRSNSSYDFVSYKNYQRRRDLLDPTFLLQLSSIVPDNIVTWTTINEDYQVTATNLNFRNGYATGSPSIGKLNNGDIVHVIETALCNDGRTWAKITFNGQSGYCCMRDNGKDYLSKNLTPDKPQVNVITGTSFSNTAISWNSCNLASEYEVKIDGVSQGRTGSTSYSKIIRAGSHNVEVIAYSSNGSSNSSGIQSFTIAKTYPEKANVTVSPGNSKSTTYISWNNCQYADSYKIRLCKSDGTVIAEKTISDFKYSSNLTAGNYNVIIYTYNNTDGTENKSNQIAFSVQAAVPSTPTLSVLAGHNYIDTSFAWNECQYADNYKLEITNKDTGKVVVNKIINGTSYSQILSTAGNYTAKVSAVNTQDNVSTPSQKIDFYVESMDCTEFDLSVSGRSDSMIVLDWTVSEHATQYDVYRYEGGKYVLIGTTEDTTFTDAGLYIDTAYKYYIKASNQWTKMDSNEVETETIILTLNGSGSESDPYIISSVEDMETMRDLINDSTTTKVFGNSCYQLTSNIDVSGVDWISAGTEKCVFNGKFNGNYYTITGLDNSLFGYCGDAVIENIVAYGNISSAKSNIGSIVGKLGKNSRIENCAFYGNVKGTDNIGGIAGNMENGGSLIRCYQIGTVSGSNGVGGIAGKTSSNAKLSYCYHAGGVVSGTGKIGGISGLEVSKAAYTECYYLKTNCSYGVSNGSNAGAVAVNETVLKNLTETLGTPFTVNPDTSVNNGYPVFTWEIPSHEFAGEGTASSPYQIGTAKDLQYLAIFVNDTYLNSKYGNAYYIQTADIDLSEITWTAIGTEKTPFNGNYNGGYRNITGLSTNTSSSYGGLFGYCGDVIVKNVIVSGTVNSKGIAGGIIAESNANCNLDEVAFIGSVNGTDAGGLVGKINSRGTIRQCYHNGTVKGTNAGGLVGNIVYDSNSVTETCFIRNSYHTNGAISGTTTGGIYGVGGGAELENCFYLKGSTNSTKNGTAANEIVMKALAETIESPFTDSDDTINNGYPVFTWQISKYEFEGTGTEENPYLIWSADDLIALQEYINNPAYHDTYANAHYEQINDIDLGDMEWTAIGMSEKLAFNGVYDGNGFTIYGLSACGVTYSGLFGQVGATSNGRNAGIYNIIIEYGTSSSSTGVVGGTAAVLMNGATADSCAVIGDLYGDSGVGGVVGIVRKSAVITNSYHNGNVNGNSNVGGILGYAESGTARIENCYHTVGNVGGNEHVGAITGYVNGAVKISNCYYLTGTCSGAVDGRSNSGVTITNEKTLKALAPTLGEAYMDNIYEMYFNDGYPIFISAAPYVDEGEDMILGDVNDDGVFNVSDAVLLQKWLLAVPNTELANWKAADFCEDDRLDVFDLCLMKRALVERIS